MNTIHDHSISLPIQHINWTSSTLSNTEFIAILRIIHHGNFHGFSLKIQFQLIKGATFFHPWRLHHFPPHIIINRFIKLFSYAEFEHIRSITPHLIHSEVYEAYASEACFRYEHQIPSSNNVGLDLPDDKITMELTYAKDYMSQGSLDRLKMLMITRGDLDIYFDMIGSK